MIRRRSRPVSLPAVKDDPVALESAWRIHQAQMDWTARVDAKAAFAFAIESAAIATTLGLTSSGRLAGFDHWWLTTLYILGLGFLLLSAGFAALVVTPRLRRSKTKIESPNNLVYFGHLRHWQPTELELALRHEPMLPQLSRQIVSMARISWTKHVRVQISFTFAIAGCVCLAACVLLSAI